MIIVTLLDACSSNRRCPQSRQYWRRTCGNSKCTFCKTTIVVSFWQTKQTAITRITKLYHLFVPWSWPRDIAFIPSLILKRYKDGGYRAVNKVYYLVCILPWFIIGWYFNESETNVSFQPISCLIVAWSQLSLPLLELRIFLYLNTRQFFLFTEF